MLEKAIRASLLRPARQPLATCLLCQWRNFSASYPRLAKSDSKTTPSNDRFSASSVPQNVPKVAKKPETAPASKEPPAQAAEKPQTPTIYAPRSYGQRVEDFTPQPLPRPIGMTDPPLPFENTGLDYRTARQRRDDFVNWNKHLQRRAQLKSLMARPYFRDWTNLALHKGKTFIAPPRIFRHDHSLYFPNLFGKTVDPEQKEPRDTTRTLRGKASVVGIFSTGWAENQVMSFIAKRNNPALHEILDQNKDVAQLVRINVEDTSRLKYWLIRMFAWNIRRLIDPSNWNKYFMVRAGITDELRESIGYLNSKVGYVYLVDGDCKIRWAGSGPANADEVDALARGLRRLLDEKKDGVWEERELTEEELWSVRKKDDTSS